MRGLAFYIFLAMTIGGLMSCAKEKNGEYIQRLAPEQRSAFPKNYYSLDRLTMVYTSATKRDTIILIGGKVEEYVVRDWHSGAYNGWSTSHEVIRKQFQSLDGSYSLALRVSTSEDMDNGYPSGGGVLIKVLKHTTSFQFFDLATSTEDQTIKAYPPYNNYDEFDTVIYNKISGVKKIIVSSVKTPYTLEFY
jgi:hypothetical protein